MHHVCNRAPRADIAQLLYVKGASSDRSSHNTCTRMLTADPLLSRGTICDSSCTTLRTGQPWSAAAKPRKTLGTQQYMQTHSLLLDHAMAADAAPPLNTPGAGSSTLASTAYTAAGV